MSTTTVHAVTESEMTMEDVDKALKNKELTQEQADLLIFDIKARPYRDRFRARGTNAHGMGK
jgi:hypothetical protein